MKQYFTPFNSFVYQNTEGKVSNHDEVHRWILDLYSKSPRQGEGNFYGPGFTTFFYDDFTSHLYTVDEFKELANFILQEADQYISNQVVHIAKHQAAMGMKPPNKIKLTNMWFNVNPPGGYQGRHHHAKNLLGGTYYISVPRGSGKIGFFNPNPFAYYNNQAPREKFLLVTDFDITPSDGDLLIWPGWMDHEISANSTKDQDRITVSFAIDWDFSND
jgi:uncharacterized protein (TIGR02466 family)